MINETTNFNSAVTVKDSNGVNIQVAYLNATLDTNNKNFNISMNVTNKVLLDVNAVLVKQQYTDFMASVTTRATELGDVIF